MPLYFTEFLAEILLRETICILFDEFLTFLSRATWHFVVEIWKLTAVEMIPLDIDNNVIYSIHTQRLCGSTTQGDSNEFVEMGLTA